MKRYTFILVPLLLLLSASQAYTQNPWARSSKNLAFSQFTSGDIDPNGNYYVAGTFTCNTVIGSVQLKNLTCGDSVNAPLPVPINDIAFASYDENGDVNWVKHLKGVQGNSVVVSRVKVLDGAVYLAGIYNKTITFEPDGSTVSLTLPDTVANNSFLARYLFDGTLDWVVPGFSFGTDASFSIEDMDWSDSLEVVANFRGQQKLPNDTTAVNASGAIHYRISDDGAIGTYSAYEAAGISDSLFVSDIAIMGIRAFISGRAKGTIKIGNTGTAADTSVTPYAGNNLFLASYSNIGVNDGIHFFTGTSVIDLETQNTDLVLAYSYTDSTIISSNDTLRFTGKTVTTVGRFTTGLTPDSWFTVQGSESTHILSIRDMDIVGNDLFLTGSFTGTELRVGSESVTASGQQDALFIKRTSGNLDWVQFAGTGERDLGYDVSVTDAGSVYAAGIFDEALRVVQDSVINEGPLFNGFAARLDICPEVTADLEALTSASFCKGNFARLRATVNANYSYEWYADDVLLTNNSATLDVEDSSRVYAAIIDNGSGCQKQTPTIRTIAWPVPRVSIQPARDSILCEGDTLIITTPFSSDDYQWVVNGISDPANTNDRISLSENGTVFLAKTNAFGCTAYSDTIATTFVAYPDSTIAPTGSFQVCATDSLVVEATDNPTYTYQWYRNGSAIAGARDFSYTIKQGGRYYVGITSGNSCTRFSTIDTVAILNSPPATIDSSGSLTKCGDNPPSLYANANANNLGLRFQWLRNGSLSAIKDTLTTLTPEISGSYRVSVSNSIGCTSLSPEVQVNLFDNPVVAIDANDDLFLCQGESVTLFKATGPDGTFDWLRNASSLGEDNTTLEVTQTGVYSLKLTDANDCEGFSNTLSIEVRAIPPANLFAQRNAACQGDSIQLIATAGTGLRYTWYRNNGLISVTENTFYTRQSGSYEVVIENTSNCTNQTNAIELDFFDKVVPDIDLTGANNFCEGDSLQLSVATDPGIDLQWMRNGNNITGATERLLTVTTAGNYQVKTEISGTCDTLSRAIIVTIRRNPVPLLTRDEDLVLSTGNYAGYRWFRDGNAVPGESDQQILVELSGNYTVEATYDNGCVNQSLPVSVCVPPPVIERNGSVLEVNTGVSYIWYLNDSPIPGSNSDNILAQQSGSYSAVVTNASGCTSETTPVSICVPAPVVTILDNNILQASFGLDYQWYLNGEPIEGENARFIQASAPGFYAVQVIDLNECEDFSREIFMEPVGIEDELISRYVQIFPNPVKDQLYFRSKEPAVFYLELRTLSGTLVRKNSFTHQLDMPVADLAAGIYLVKIAFQETVFTKKIFIE